MTRRIDETMADYLSRSLALNQSRVDEALKKPRPDYTKHQQKFGITYHFAWVLNLPWGEFQNYEQSDILLRDIKVSK